MSISTLATQVFAVMPTYEQKLIDKVPDELRTAVLPVLLSLWKGNEAHGVPNGAVIEVPINIVYSKNVAN